MSRATTHLPPSILPSPCIHLTWAQVPVALALGLLGATLQVPSPEAVPKATRVKVVGHGGPRAPGLSNSWTVCPSPSSPMARGYVAFPSAWVSHSDQHEAESQGQQI